MSDPFDGIELTDSDQISLGAYTKLQPKWKALEAERDRLKTELWDSAEELTCERAAKILAQDRLQVLGEERDRLRNIKARICRDGGQASIEEAEELVVWMLEALEAVEWVLVFGSGMTCPWCGKLQMNGHAPDCKRQRALGGKT